MQLLLVEDEAHKIEELTGAIRLHYGEEAALDHVDSVNAAYWAIVEKAYDIIILDMALPTFSTDGGATERGQDQAHGGVEVLRALKARGQAPNIVIITQYPEITVGGKRVKLSKAPEILSARYGQRVIGSVHYKYGSASNNTKLVSILKKIK